MSKKKKIAVILFNLGGPDKKEAVKPFLFNLFNDKAIISLPNPFRYFLAKFISSRREKTAQEIYSYLGDKSPILAETIAQKESLEAVLNHEKAENEYKIFISMRYWHPFSKESVKKVKEYGADEMILLPLYPQFSTATTESSFKDWLQECDSQDVEIPAKSICCYPSEDDFIKSHTNLLKQYYDKVQDKDNIRILFSAHGLPKKVIEAGDSYQYQIELTAKKIIENLEIENLDWLVCYQSKVGRLEWLTPSTEDEIARAGKDEKGLVIVPVAFVSEHSETLVELDIEYKHLADEIGLKEYIRVPTLSVEENYIKSLANICKKAGELSDGDICSDKLVRICPNSFKRCIANKI